MNEFTVEESSRIDGVIAKHLKASRSFVKVLLDQGKVNVNEATIYKPSFKVHHGDVVYLNFEPLIDLDIPEINLEILYEDDDCLVVVKPEGVLTHSKGVFNPEATVSTFIRTRTTGMNDNRGGIVHRLDRVTSGLLICAKNEKALTWLQKQFSERKVKKTYIAVVEGTMDPLKALIDLPIERNPKKPQTFRVGANGKAAKTTYEVVGSNDTYSLLQLTPETGRTHQLRVHLAYLGHPILGDLFYGGTPANRVYLHAYELEITLPNKTRKTFVCPIPKQFQNLVS